MKETGLMANRFDIVVTGAMRARASALALVGALLLVAPSIGSAASGGATLAGKSRLGVPRCGAARMTFSGTLGIRPDGTWTADGGDDAFSGTYAVMGRTGRKLALTMDATSQAAFIASVAEEIASLCESPPVTVTASRAKVLTLVLDRKLTKAKLIVRYAFTGTAGGRSGTAAYRLIARGAWSPA
jgi:hypothetical protein